ncbi:hypothetical protein HYFRA_00008961 [Hymenoscyphus fraxineus]|uniref:Uncharacterized protein n=1 Tax=Hymenoscyphus fraxineus TaxID=746836 RepID=A0A9N9PSQ1_9HELO|nr:hypothetical protein HYFRA_00008961 [Hymenoscyphus fraxineus]
MPPKNRKKATKKKKTPVVQDASQQEESSQPSITPSASPLSAPIPDITINPMIAPHGINRPASDVRWRLHPSVQALLHRFRDEIITRFYPTASHEQAKRHTSYIYEELVPLLERVPPSAADAKPADQNSMDRQALHSAFAPTILKLIKSFVEEKGEDFLKGPFAPKDAYQIDFWKRVLSLELTYQRDKEMEAKSRRWEHDAFTWSNAIRVKCEKLKEANAAAKKELARLTRKCEDLQKIKNSKSEEDKIHAACQDLLTEIAVRDEKCRVLELSNKQIKDQTWLLCEETNILVNERHKLVEDHNKGIREHNKLVNDYRKVVQENSELTALLEEAGDLTADMLNDECKEGITRMLHDLSELKSEIQVMHTELAFANEQNAWLQEKYEIAEQAREIERGILESHEQTMMGINNRLLANLKAMERAAREDSSKEINEEEATKDESANVDSAQEKVADQQITDESISEETLLSIPPTPTPDQATWLAKEENLQRQITNLQTELSLARQAWAMETHQQTTEHQTLLTENQRLASQLAAEKQARAALEHTNQTLEADKLQAQMDCGKFLSWCERLRSSERAWREQEKMLLEEQRIMREYVDSVTKWMVMELDKNEVHGQKAGVFVQSLLEVSSDKHIETIVRLGGPEKLRCVCAVKCGCGERAAEEGSAVEGGAVENDRGEAGGSEQNEAEASRDPSNVPESLYHSFLEERILEMCG